MGKLYLFTFYLLVWYTAPETAEYAQQTTLQLPASDVTQQHQQPTMTSDGRQSAHGSQTLLAANITTGGGGVSGTAGGSSGDVVISIDEKQPLICRPDHIVTIDTVLHIIPVN